MSTTRGSGTHVAHIGIAVESLDAQMTLYRDVLGLATTPVNDSDGARIVAFVAGDTLVELLEPAAPDSPVGKFVAKRGPGIHHICFAVPDLDATMNRCRSAGLQLVDETARVGAEGKKIAFLHPRSTGGILIELTERDALPVGRQRSAAEIPHGGDLDVLDVPPVRGPANRE